MFISIPKDKYLIVGKGWIGNMLKSYLGNQADLIGRDLSFVEPLNKYNIIINTAAKTNIDWCEQNKQKTFQDNVIFANDLAIVCQAENIKYVFFSSACIFESKNIRDIKYEDSKPNPQCFYTETKVMAEKLIQEANPNALIIRPRLPLSEVPHPRNTINKLLTYDKINNNQESVTVIEDMIPKLIELIENDKKGIFHLVNEGTISPAEIASAFGHSFKTVSKKSQDKRLANEGRTKRVTTYVGSKRTVLLPDIRTRIKSLVKRYNGN